MTRIFVVKTSCLCELYEVPGFSDPRVSVLLRERRVSQEQARFYVPLACLYQLCDHIVNVGDGSRRRRLARQVARDVESSLHEDIPWVITPPRRRVEFADLIRVFSSDPGRLQLGLTNVDVMEIAHQLKRKYSSSPDYRVHIWTTRQDLKAYEPDPEPDPLV